MTKKTKTGNRFNYAKQEAQTTSMPAHPTPDTHPSKPSPVLTTVPKRAGRMEQDREQLNVRLPTQLKRRALAAAAMEGLTVGELIEKLLLAHLEEA